MFRLDVMIEVGTRMERPASLGKATEAKRLQVCVPCNQRSERLHLGIDELSGANIFRGHDV